MQGEHSLFMFNTDLTHAQVHAHVHREGERFLRFANVLLLAFKVPNIDHDPSLLKQALLSVRSFLLQDIFPGYTLAIGVDELLRWFSDFLKQMQIEHIECSRLLMQLSAWRQELNQLLESCFDQFISVLWDKLQSSVTLSLYECYSQWLQLCDDTLQTLGNIVLDVVNRRCLPGQEQITAC
ncbi:hypothetical protein ACR9PT_03800 [Piscirickettsia salmonis]|uniref:hypothetical protein n=1 Tax=Piscirickettsia salmonis TaxID=1238 RepID=UPI003EBCCFFA